MYCPSEAHIVLSPVTPEKHKEDRSIKNGKQDALWSVGSARKYTQNFLVIIEITLFGSVM